MVFNKCNLSEHEFTVLYVRVFFVNLVTCIDNILHKCSVFKLFVCLFPVVYRSTLFHIYQNILFINDDCIIYILVISGNNYLFHHCLHCHRNHSLVFTVVMLRITTPHCPHLQCSSLLFSSSTLISVQSSTVNAFILIFIFSLCSSSLPFCCLHHCLHCSHQPPQNHHPSL